LSAAVAGFSAKAELGGTPILRRRSIRFGTARSATR
jgi:hypothetical protein